MPTLTVTAGKLLEVATYLRDKQGKNFLSAVSAVDHLGYGDDVAGYFGTERGRDVNSPGSWGTPMTVAAPPKRFAVRYHLAHVGAEPPQRVRLQVWLDDGEEVPSVVGVWPTAPHPARGEGQPVHPRGMGRKLLPHQRVFAGGRREHRHRSRHRGPHQRSRQLHPAVPPARLL